LIYYLLVGWSEAKAKQKRSKSEAKAKQKRSKSEAKAKQKRSKSEANKVLEEHSIFQIVT
jgi:hypothetical protein